jgi:hypothetical protein
MKVVVIYKSQSEHGTAVEDYLRDFLRQTGKELETLNPESKEGIDLCQVYDIVEYPTMIALSDDGLLQNSWRGLPLPTITEVSYYT